MPSSPRGAARLADDLGWQQVLTAVSQRVDRLIEARACSIAAYARGAGCSESGLQEILKASSDPKLSTLYRLGRFGGVRLYVFFEADGLGRRTVPPG